MTTHARGQVANHPEIIWDSRKAYKIYRDFSHSIAVFNIPHGHVARLRLYAPPEYLRDMTFTFLEIPPHVSGADADCYTNANIYSKYRETCTGVLGDNDPSTSYNPYNHSIVALGLHPSTSEFRESIVIEWPGSYMIEQLNCGERRMCAIADCVHPSIVVATYVPASYGIRGKCTG
jgi:hypothetical protein